MPESTIDPPVKEPPIPPTPTRPTAPPPDPPEPETDEQASSLTFKQRLSAAAQSLKGRGTTAEIEDLRGQLAMVTVERDQARIAVTTAKGTISRLTSERDQALGLAETATAQLAELKKKPHDQKVIDAAIDMVAEAHVPPAQLPVSGVQGESAPQTKEQVEAALAAVAPDLPGHEGEASQKRHAILQAWHSRSRK